MEMNKIENTFLCGIKYYTTTATKRRIVARGELLLVAVVAAAAGGTPKPTLRVNMKIHFLSTDIPSSSSSASSVPGTVSVSGGCLFTTSSIHSLYYHS